MKIRGGDVGGNRPGAARCGGRPVAAGVGSGFPGPFVNLTAAGSSPAARPRLGVPGARVIMANERWLVVQNNQGQPVPGLRRVDPAVPGPLAGHPETP